MVATQDVVSHLCYVKATWAAEWTEQPDLVCLRFSDQAGPAHGSAEFRWQYGEQLRPAIGSRAADSTFAVVERSDFLGQYVKVVASNGLTWYGVFVDKTDTRDGSHRDDEESPWIDQGVETLAAFALSYLLDLNPIRSAAITGGGDDVDGGEVIGDPVPFNGGFVTSGSRGVGLRENYDGLWVEDDATDEFPVAGFAADTDRFPGWWTAKRVLTYLIAYQLPLDAAGGVLIPWRVEETDRLDYQIPMVDPAGMTVWQVMNKVVDRRRALGLKVRVDVEGGEELLTLQVFTSLADDVTLPDGTTLDKNTSQTPLNLSQAVNITQMQLTESALHQADVVRVIGERRGSVITLDADDFEQDWDASLVSDYNTARSGETGFDDLTDDEKARANAHYRARDEFRNVFAQWRWFYYTPDSFPELDEEGEPKEGGNMWQWLPALRLESYLPMVEGVDYTQEFEPVAGVDLDDFIPARVWFGGKLAERLDAEADTVEDGRKWSVQVRVLNDAPGLRLEVVGGQQHFIASDEYAANGTYEELEGSDHALALTSWTGTFYVQQQDRVVEQMPAEPSSGDVERVVELQIPGAHLDLLVAGATVDYGPSAGSFAEIMEAKTSADGGWLRDDRPRLKNIARLAWEYYSQPQQSLNLSFRAVSDVLSVGQLITSIVENDESEDVNSVVTSLDVNLEAQTTVIRSAFAELDFAELVP